MSEDRPVLDQVNLVVRDMDAALEFYRRLGVAIPDRDPAWDAHHRSANTPGGIDFDLDSQKFGAMWNAGATGPGPVLGFRVPSRASVDRLHAELTGAGYRSQQEPYDAFWGARYAVVEDPDRNAVGIMSESDEAYRTAPPDVS
jgi:catechol 2,3-dioxygenase-like lactoylglutathione lyase family enzyme